jgi:beta-lactam-binding protein with PASTA domain
VVTLTSNLVSVPNVVGLDPAGAKAALTAAGLKANLQSVVDPTCNHLGEVMSQSPAAGTLVNPGSVVTIRVGRPPAKPCP